MRSCQAILLVDQDYSRRKERVLPLAEASRISNGTNGDANHRIGNGGNAILQRRHQSLRNLIGLALLPIGQMLGQFALGPLSRFDRCRMVADFELPASAVRTGRNDAKPPSGLFWISNLGLSSPMAKSLYH